MLTLIFSFDKSIRSNKGNIKMIPTTSIRLVKFHSSITDSLDSK